MQHPKRKFWKQPEQLNPNLHDKIKKQAIEEGPGPKREWLQFIAQNDGWKTIYKSIESYDIYCLDDVNDLLLKSLGMTEDTISNIKHFVKHPDLFSIEIFLDVTPPRFRIYRKDRIVLPGKDYRGYYDDGSQELTRLLDTLDKIRKKPKDYLTLEQEG